MPRTVALFLLSLAIASAQISIVGAFPPQLKGYLELTDAQVTAITQANADLDTMRTAKMRAPDSSTS